MGVAAHVEAEDYNDRQDGNRYEVRKGIRTIGFGWR